MIGTLTRLSSKVKSYMKNNPIVEEWLELAESDLAFAKTGFESDDFYHLICFHCQQSIEKILKAYLVDQEIKFPKVHDLIQLNKLCSEADVSFENFNKDLKYLNTFYIETRYAGGFFQSITKVDAQKAIESAIQILNFVKEKLK